MEIFRLFGTVSINKAAAMGEISAVTAHGKASSATLVSAFNKIGKVAMATFAAIGVAGGIMFVSAIKKAAEFELAMAKVQAITGATEDEFGALQEKAKQLGLETSQTMTDIADGMEKFGRAGFTATEIIDAMDGAVALAESQVMDLGEAIDTTSAILRGMRLEASESERVVNALAATASSSNTDISTLSESMKYFAPIAADLNIPLEEALTLIAKLGDAGIKGTLATRTLTTAFSRIAKPTSEMVEVMEELNLEFYDAEGNFVGATEMIRRLEESFQGLTQQQRSAALSTLFGSEAIKQFSILIAAGKDDLTEYEQSITGTTEAFDQQAAMLDTLVGRTSVLKGSWDLFLITIGKKFIPVFKEFLEDVLIPTINRMTEWAEETDLFNELADKLRGFFLWLVNHAGTIKSALSGILKAFAAIIAVKLALWIYGVVTAFKTLTLAIASNPIGLLITAVAGLTLGVATLTKKIQDNSAAMKENADKARDLETALTDTSDAAGVLSGAVDLVGEKLLGLDIPPATFIAIMDKMRELKQAVLDLPVEDMADAWKQGVQDIIDEYKDLVPAINDIAPEIVTIFENKGTAAGGGFSANFLAADAFQSESFAKLGTDAKEAFISAFQSGELPSVESPEMSVSGLPDTSWLATWAAAQKAAKEEAEDTVEEVKGIWDGISEELKKKTWRDLLGIPKGTTDEYKDEWDDTADSVGRTLGNMARKIGNHFRDQKREAERHADEMVRIDERYNDEIADLDARHKDDSTNLDIEYQRQKEDIELEYRRRMAEAAAGGYESVQEVESWYQQQLEDAAIEYTKQRTDLEDSYTKESTRLAEERQDAVDDEVQAHKDAVKPIGQALWDIVKKFLAAAREELWILAAVEAAKAATYSAAVLLGGAWAAGLAAQHGAAALAATLEAGALTLGGYLAGFKEGGLFTSPTLLPPTLVAEGGAPEAFIPLTPEVLGNIGAGIAESTTALSVDLRGLFEGATINVRDDSDIRKIARETHSLWKSRMRLAGGYPA